MAESSLEQSVESSSIDLPARPRSVRGGTLLGTNNICGRLTLDRTEACVGERVRLSWDFSASSNGEEDSETPVPSERDWIGLFRPGTEA